MSRSTRPPSYRRHSSGQARVTINGRDHLLGPYNSAASKEAYRRLFAEWAANPSGKPEQSNQREQQRRAAHLANLLFVETAADEP